jgi:hypothetical protein
MALVFTPASTTQAGAQGEAVAMAAGWWWVPGTLTFSGSYATNGDALTAANIAKNCPVGGTPKQIIAVGSIRGNQPEYDLAAGKLKFYSSANTEMTAAAYNAALTASPVPCAFWVRI